MAHVRLASWHGAHAPGEVIEVPDDQVQGLRYDGRISEVVGQQVAASAADTSEANDDAAESEPVLTEQQHERLGAAAKRRRGKSDG